MSDIIRGDIPADVVLKGVVLGDNPYVRYERDYNKLLNKPTLNGEEIVGEMNETDPTVPAWAKEDHKPEYTAAEVGALPEDTFIPVKESDLEHDMGYIREHQSLSEYRKAADQDAIDAQKQDKLTAGSNVTIQNGVISAKDTVYDDTYIRRDIQNKQDKLTAGENITIENGIISAESYDDLELRLEVQGKQDKLTAGANITISGNVINSTGGTDEAEVNRLIDEKTTGLKENIAQYNKECTRRYEELKALILNGARLDFAVLNKSILG